MITKHLRVLYFIVLHVRALANCQRNVSLLLTLIFQIVKYQSITCFGSNICLFSLIVAQTIYLNKSYLLKRDLFYSQMSKTVTEDGMQTF